MSDDTQPRYLATYGDAGPSRSTFTQVRTTTTHRAVLGRFSSLIATALFPVAALSGCAQDSSQARATPDATVSTDSPTPTASATASRAPAPSRTPRPPRTPRPTEGDGDSEGDDEPAAAGGGICANLSEDEVAGVLGGGVTGAAISGGGCTFTQGRSSRPAAVFTETAATTSGAMDQAKQDAISAVEGDPEDLTDIGDQAFVVTGTSFGGEDIQGAGAVRIGARLIAVNLGQGIGLRRVKVRALVIELLRLAVTRAG